MLVENIFPARAERYGRECGASGFGLPDLPAGRYVAYSSTDDDDLFVASC